MKFLGRLIAGWAFVVALVSASYGLTITFSDFESGYPLKFLSGSTTYSSTFDIRYNGIGSDGHTYNFSDFAPGELELKYFSAEFWFADDRDSEKEKVNVYLGGTSSSWLIFENVRVYGDHTSPPASYDSIDRTFQWTNTADVKFLNALLDGIITYKVKASTGDTYLKQGKIVAVFCVDDPVCVPDSGSTLGLLAGAISGLAFFRGRSGRRGALELASA